MGQRSVSGRIVDSYNNKRQALPTGMGQTVIWVSISMKRALGEVTILDKES